MTRSLTINEGSHFKEQVRALKDAMIAAFQEDGRISINGKHYRIYEMDQRAAPAEDIDAAKYSLRYGTVDHQRLQDQFPRKVHSGKDDLELLSDRVIVTARLHASDFAWKTEEEEAKSLNLLE